MITLSADTTQALYLYSGLTTGSASTLSLVNSSYNTTGYTFDLSLASPTGLSYIYTIDTTGITKGIYTGKFLNSGGTITYCELIKII